MQPDLVDKTFHARELRISRGLCGVEVDLVFGPEMVLQHPAVFGHLFKDEQRFSPGDPGPECAHHLCHFDDLGGNIDRDFVGIHRIRPFPL